MMDKKQIQSFTSNFPNLQGLKSVPISLLLLMIVVWANQQSGPARDLTLPILITLSMLLFYWFVDRYYKLSYGTIQQTGQKKAREILLSTAAGILALVCFFLDTTRELPISLLGVLWAGLFLFDGYRIARSMPGKTFQFFWFFATILLVASLLPVFGAADWWLGFGIHDQLSAVLIISSILMFISGILWHAFLTQNLKVGD